MGRVRDNGGVTFQCGVDLLDNDYYEEEGVWEEGRWEGVDDMECGVEMGRLSLMSERESLAEGKTYALYIQANEAGERK